MQAIILCGGLGTRLRPVIGEKQKAMTEVQGEPFLVNIIKYLKVFNVTKVIFAIGYKGEEVKKYFGDSYYFGVEVKYAEEKEPLGTGGAIRNCLDIIEGESVFVLNGDTLFPIDLNLLIENYNEKKTDMTIACKEIVDKDRYGTIVFSKDEGIIEKFLEKNVDDNDEVGTKNDSGYINGGIYLMSKKLISTIKEGEKISLENDLMPKWLLEKKVIGGVISSANFIDIGTPESLYEFIKSKIESEVEEVNEE